MHTILEPSAAGLGSTSAYLMLTTGQQATIDDSATSRACAKRKFVLLETHSGAANNTLCAVASDDEPAAKQMRTTTAATNAYTHLVQELCGSGGDTPSSTEDCDVANSGGGGTIAYVLYDSGGSGCLSLMEDEHDDEDGRSHPSSMLRFNGYRPVVQTHQHGHLHHDDHELTDLLDLDRRQLFFDAATSDEGVDNQRTLVTLPNASLLSGGCRERDSSNTITSTSNTQTMSASTTTTTTDGDYFRCSAVVVEPAAAHTPPATMNHQHTHHRQTAITEDLEDRNLSWLFNFKLDELPHLSPEVAAGATVGGGPVAPLPPTTRSQQTSGRSGRRRSNSSQTSRADIRTKVDEIIKEATALEALEQQQHQQQQNQSGGTHQLSALHAAHKEGGELVGGAFLADQFTQLSGGGGVGDDVVQLSPKKPPFTYTELIEYALEDKGELTVSGIYQWIFDRFPYYKSNDDRWKNSVRHNLSINPHFRKGSKAAQGAGHLWTISSRDSESNLLAWEHKKQRFELFFKMERIHQQQLRDQHQQQQQQQTYNSPDPISSPTATTTPTSTADFDPDPQRQEIAMAVAHIPIDVPASQQIQTAIFMDHNSPSVAATSPEPLSANLNSSPPPSSSQTSGSFHFDALDADEALRRSAGEILNGVRRTVQVQVIGAGDSSISGQQHHQHQHQQLHLYGADEALLLDTDFLNPVPKEQVVQECGLRDHPTNQRLLGDYHQANDDHHHHQHQQHQEQHHHLQHIQQHHHHNHNMPLLDSSSVGGGGSGSSSGGSPHNDQQQQQPYFVTDIDPISLGVHMLDGSGHEPAPSHHLHQHQQHHNHHHLLHQQQLHHHHQQHHHHHHHGGGGAMVDEVEVLFGDDFNLNYFGYLTPGGGNSSAGSCSNLMT